MPSADRDTATVATTGRVVPADDGVGGALSAAALDGAAAGKPGRDRGGLSIPRWVPIAGLLTAVVGVAVATYLTIAHFDTASLLACPGTRVVNCEKVTTSPESHILGIPVAVLGLVFFVAIAVAMLPAAWRSTNPLVRYGRLLFALTGVGMVVYLVYTELFTLDAVCLWCTAVHVLTLILFTIVVAGTALAVPPDRAELSDLSDYADETDETDDGADDPS